MRRFLAAGGLFLGLWMGGANAQELPPYPAATAIPQVARPAGDERPVLATLGRPVAIPSAPSHQPPRPIFTDQQVTPASFSAPLIGLPRPLARLQRSESPQPLPEGPIIDDFPSAEPAPPKNDSNGSPEKLGPPRLVPIPEKNGALKVPGSMSEHTVCSPSSDCDDSGICCDDCTCPRCWGLGLFRRWAWDAVPVVDNRFWFRGEYLLWWIKDSPLPPLVTTSPLGTPRELAGVFGAPGTTVLFPDGVISNPERSGGRFTLGFWLDNCQTFGLESTTFFLGDRSITFRDGSGGVPILARPFFNVVSGMEASELVAFPGVLAGNIAVSSSSQLWGTELNLRTNICRGCFWHLDWLLGVRFLELEEHLGIAESLMVPASAGSLAGSSIIVQDSFGTRNVFVGGQTGLDIGLQRGRWSLDLLLKVALGNTHETININGNTQFAVPGLPVTAQPGGLYALPSNMGHFSRDRFAVVPEAGFTVGFQLTPRLRALVGYSFLYNSAVARPGQQIDRGLNVTQLPSQVGPGTLVGPARPAPILHGSDFWAQGLNFGLELRY